jgi:hypothetical protein
MLAKMARGAAKSPVFWGAVWFRAMAIALTRIDRNVFRVMDAAYEHGGISGAARHLHLSSAAVSHAQRAGGHGLAMQIMHGLR